MDESEESREQTLVEWCTRLPDIHRVNKELDKLRETIGLLNSMILSGENHSETSSAIFEKASDILKGVVGPP